MNNVICLMGPTASGKTDLALKLAEDFPVELISVDSALIYREMNIGTAKPDAGVLKQYPHHLIDILNPDETYSAGRFVQAVNDLIPAIQQRGKIPLLVGGTMLYFHALQSGLAALPEADEATRAEIAAQALMVGWEKMHEKLVKIDPRAAARIKPQDPHRISRALEVYALTGKPLTVLQNEKTDAPYHAWINLILYPPRDWLHERIRIRFKAMLEAGLIDEVNMLLTKYPRCRACASMRSVGYRQVADYLDNIPTTTLEQLEEKGMAATRQLAKRQCTWLKSWPEATWFDPRASDVYQQVKRRIQHDD
jgi:tRNA dimethylallyltransferase